MGADGARRRNHRGKGVSAGRAITLPVPPTIRFLPNAKHAPSGQRFPCMVAAFALHPDNRVCAIHRTFLTPSGTDKAPVQARR
ncbi:DUF7146 domain-containing protein [Azospirillum thiophilum]|uniref:DUF7146 domain-containing protein n=1 Tax=Azospirillum thiophilum TaxID=528244 RepID=UPI003CE4B4C9